MTFELTHSKVINTEIPDYKVLEDKLKEFSDSVNYDSLLFWSNWFYTSRVFFTAYETTNTNIRVSVSFKSEHARKHPEKYGADFREECISKVAELANDCLGKDRSNFLLMVKEDHDDIEERFYVRK